MIRVSIRAKFERATRDRRRAIASALLLIGEAFRGEIARYPGPVRRPMKWMSVQQRAAYFAKMRDAGDRPPYRRSVSRLSERLSKSYVVLPSSRGVVVRSRARYSAYVQSRRLQQPFHRATGWSTDMQAVSRVLRDRALRRAVGKLIS